VMCFMWKEKCDSLSKTKREKDKVIDKED